jgi:hypothetical protein
MDYSAALEQTSYMNRAKEILSQLDECNSNSTFPMLDNGYIYPAGTKMTAYRGDDRWVLIVEVIGFSYRGGGHNGISNCLHIYGNCLNYPPGIRNENFISPTDDVSTCSTFDDEECFYLNPGCDNFLLCGEIVPIIRDRNIYSSHNIILEDEEKINAFDFLRLLDQLYHDKLIATEKEIRERIPTDIPKILELHEWHHPNLVKGDLPSENETFKQIAKVIETGSADFYKPTHKPNTHWMNWPEGGTL